MTANTSPQPLHGLHVTLTHRLSLNKLDTPALAREMKAAGVAGVIPMRRGEAAEWSRAERNHAPFLAAGLRVIPGVDLDAFPTTDLTVTGILRALDASELIARKAGHTPAAVVLSWGPAWRGRRTEADVVVQRVVAARPDAPARCVDLPGYAPLFTLDGHTQARRWTDTTLPSGEFGILARHLRAARLTDNDEALWDEGVMLQRLRWARSSSQFRELAARRSLDPAWTIVPTVPGRGRSVQDTIDLLLQEPTQVMQSWDRLDDEAHLGLRVVAALRDFGYTGDEAVQEFQSDRNLPPTGLIGEREIQWLQLISEAPPAQPAPSAP